MPELSILKPIPVFQGLSDEALGKIAAITQMREAKRGTLLFENGDKRKEFIIVLSGQVHIYRTFKDEVQTLALLGAHTFLVESALINPDVEHHHLAEVTEDAQLLVISGKDFQKFRQQEPAIANVLFGNIMGNLTDRLHHANNKLVTVYATGKIATSYSNLDNLIEALLQTITETIRAKKALFAWYRPMENRIVIEKAIGYEKNQDIESLKLSLRDDPILGEIHRTQRDIFITHEVFKAKPNLETAYSSASMLGVKVRTGGEVVGAILLGDKEGKRDFNYNNQILLHIIVRQIALAIREAEHQQNLEGNEELHRVYIPPL
ncbi:MAG: cyclic nucleotide-binding domain-containing protein [Candidatus Nomurabacteria bacterium]|nr:MAG: cyclic nucleotide-binding domain-containing protein [Candidatus Nomurabacteria bacterium]